MENIGKILFLFVFTLVSPFLTFISQPLMAVVTLAVIIGMATLFFKIRRTTATALATLIWMGYSIFCLIYFRLYVA